MMLTLVDAAFLIIGASNCIVHCCLVVVCYVVGWMVTLGVLWLLKCEVMDCPSKMVTSNFILTGKIFESLNSSFHTSDKSVINKLHKFRHTPLCGTVNKS
jgi:hypothetical protein